MRCDDIFEKDGENAVHIHKNQKYIFVTNFKQVCADSWTIS